MSISTPDITTAALLTNGATVDFPFSFRVHTYGDVDGRDQVRVTLVVIATGAESVLTRGASAGQYSVALNADQDSSPGGTVTMVSTYATGYRVFIQLNPSFTQQLELTSAAAFNHAEFEKQLDQMVQQSLLLRDRTNRAPRVSVQAGESFDGEITGPVRAGYAIYVNSGATGYEFRDPSGASASSDGDGAIIVNDYLTGTDWGAAFNDAAADLASTGGVLRVAAGTDLTHEDEQIVLTKGNVEIDLRGVTFRPKLSGASTFKIGSGASEIGRITIRGGWFRYTSTALGGATQPLFELRGITDFWTIGCSSTLLYQLMKWGDPADAQACSRWYDMACRWLYRTNANGGHSHAILADGSNGGYYNLGSLHGGDASNIAGEVNLIQLTSAAGPARFDGAAFPAGVVSNFDYAIKAVDARITNVDISPATRFDEMQSYAVFIDVSSGASKGGCNSIKMRGGYGGSGGCGIIRVRNGHASLGAGDINVENAYTRNSTGNVVKFETTGSGIITNAHVTGLSMEDYNPSDANQDAIVYDGDVRHFAIDNISLKGKNAATYLARRAVYDNTLATCEGSIGVQIWGDVNTKIVERTNAGNLAGRYRVTPVPVGYLFGMTLANGTDATNDIDFSAGRCLDSTGFSLITCGALTKQLDAAWAVGSAAGGLDAGSIANATYHCHAIRKISDGSGDYIFSLSHDKSATCTMTIASPAVVTMTGHGLVAGSPIKFSTTGALPTGVTAGTQYYVISTGLSADAFQFSTSIGGSAVNSSGSQSGTHTCLPGPVMPSGYSSFRRVGSIIRSGATILGFIQNGDEFTLKVPVAASDSASPGTSAITKVLTTPVGIKVDAIVTSGGRDATAAAATYGLVTPLDITDTAPTSALFNWTIGEVGAVPNHGFANLRVRTDTAASIRLRVDASTADLTLKTVTHGWIDTRGRLAA